MNSQELIALKKEIFKWLIDSGKILIGVFILVMIIFKIVYYNESILNIIRFLLALFWVYLLPGFFILSIWKDKFNSLERVIGGFAVGAAIIPLISYLLALINSQLRVITYVFPLLVLIFCLFVIYKKKDKEDSD